MVAVGIPGCFSDDEIFGRRMSTLDWAAGREVELIAFVIH